MELSQLHNPFDFANPVSDPSVFAGRSDEMDEIRYYLEHASKSPRAINFAVMGERASGKTSLLNMIEIEAQQRDFIVVRVDLDEADSRSQMVFFCKLFDSLLTTVCFQGAFGGLAGRTYDTYRDMVDAYEVPDDKTFCPFIFPIQYAKAMSRQNTQAVLSDIGFKRDLTRIQTEVDQPVAILFDECDVLTRSRVHLEKLRNIFMNTPGFMLVFTGTSNLFPLMDDVFSPIIRQFKKIRLRPFERLADTRACITQLIEKAGIPDPDAAFDLETYGDVQEIHDLTGGRPYEIQLVCHFLFRRIQEGRAQRMELTVDILDDVLEELQTSQDLSTRPVIRAVRRLDQRRLEGLGALCICDGHVSFEQAWFAQHVFRQTSEWTKETMRRCLGDLEEDGIIGLDAGLIHFAGDDFDRVYCKYFAKRQGVPVSIIDTPFELWLAVNLDLLVQKAVGECLFAPSSVPFGPTDPPSIRGTVTAMADTDETEDVFKSGSGVAETVYWTNLACRARDSFHIVSASLTAPGAETHRWYGCKGQDPENNEDRQETPLDKVKSAMSILSQRAEAAGGALATEVYTFPRIPDDVIKTKVQATTNQGMRSALANGHALRAVEAYLAGDMDETAFHLDIVQYYDWTPEPGMANNLGYMSMAFGQLQAARELLERALRESRDPQTTALPIYNLGVIDAREGELATARAKFESVIDQMSAVAKSERMCLCLFVLSIDEEGNVEIEESYDVDLLETAKLAAHTMHQLVRR